ncbi:putative (E)-4-hydroxy-3-methylbut-2-enyl-diphosphate synthase (ferredoxin) [Helianthus anomalus]
MLCVVTVCFFLLIFSFVLKNLGEFYCEFLGEFLRSEYEQLKETSTWAQGIIGCVFSVSDRRAQSEQLEYTDDDYQKELEHIEKVFVPLVEKCKKYGRAMRIGTNHGSLSDRIMSYYGDSPWGMVESAFEFARICRKLDFHNFVFSMKASNPVIMVQVYRLLVAEMYVQGWDYPLHLGVTEAGEGEDGRMKSAIGIGTLLQDGLGDTIRVLLIEPPEEEIDPCRKLANLGMKASQIQQGVAPFEEKHRSYFDFQRRTGDLPVQKEVDYRGLLHRDGSALMSVSLNQLKTPELFYRSLAAKLVLGMPLKLPPVDDKDARLALKRLIDVSMGVIAPLSEQLTKPLPNAMVLVNLNELSTGAHKLLPEGMRLVDGLGDGILSEAPDQDFEFLRNTSFNLLQGCRMRNTKTIAIMGCIVNGPGEMADTDFGYVGGAPRKIDLYVGKTVVQKGIAMENATDALIQLIKYNGRWVDPPAEE